MRILVLVVCIGLGHSSSRADDIDDFVRAEMKKQKVPGLALAVVREGKVVKAEGYGLANVEHDVPVKRGTVFQSGSLGKMFTAAAAMLLVNDGKLKLDEPVSRHFSDVPDSWKRITARHLLTHTAGIREYTSILNLKKDYTEDELLKLAYGFKTEFAPGEKWKYSNTGYAVLGILISKAGGKFYGDQMQERIFKPLGMKTARIINEADIIPHRAAGYRLVRGELKNQEWVAPTVNTTGDGSLYLTLDDLIQWNNQLGSEKLFPSVLWKTLWTPAKLLDGKETTYSMGWQLGTVNGHKRTHHGGAWQGFTTYFDRYPDDQLTVIVLTNLAAPNSKPGRIAEGVAAIVEPKLAKK